MEKKTNEKLEIFKFLKKLAESSILIKLAEIVSSMESQ